MDGASTLRPSRVTALLGPTNTGKTHRAVERMLKHPSGMFGLPLRLLAREVYERVCARSSPEQVALVTGEEKRVPPSARYFICTVEAMPLDRKVSFVAVDEVQLAGDRQRGHVFTDRILNCRGLDETVFLGSDTIEALLLDLVPGLEVERAARFSELTFAGSHRLSRVPKRSAVVAFSASAVYSVAERLKSMHGGAAVVLGALSPRTRNAQVELYQSGDVGHLVATDAIGMGLNLDLDHVAFAATRKFDGRANRDLTDGELAQIAGRAGRFKNPGTFGSVRPVELDVERAKAVEGHRFAPVRRIFWRNTRLDFTSTESLRTSLERRPNHAALIQVRGEDDQFALETLHRDDAIRAMVGEESGVRRLWDICQIPDFRKTLTDSHLRLLKELAGHLLSDSGVLPEDWVGARIARLDRVDGDIETLMSRIAWIRTWTYVTFRRDWVGDPTHWQERTRAIEDRLSDALHDALTARFVEIRQQFTLADAPARVDGDQVFLGPVGVGRLRGFDFVAEGALPRGTESRIRAGIARPLAARLEDFELDDDGAITIDSRHRIVWRDGVLATLKPGDERREPKIALHRLPWLTGPDKNRVAARVERFVRGTVEAMLGDLRRPAPPGRVRGLLYAIEQGLGSVDRREVFAEVRSLDHEERRQLARYGVRIGALSLYLPRLLKPHAMRVRARLYSVQHGVVPSIAAPEGARPAVDASAQPPAFWEAIGYRVVGDLAVRVDILETCAATLRKSGRKGPFEVPDSVKSRLGCTAEQLDTFVLGLGFRKLADGRFRSR